MNNDIENKILDLIKAKGKLILAGNREYFEVIEYVGGNFINYGGDTVANTEEYREIIPDEKALDKICYYYRGKAKIFGTWVCPGLMMCITICAKIFLFNFYVIFLFKIFIANRCKGVF
jgi:hypothetical protein